MKNLRSRKSIVLSLLLTFVLLVAGCGEEEKYNKMKNEVLQEAKVAGTISSKTPEWKQKWTGISKKMKEMQKIAEKNTTLNNDWIMLDTRLQSMYEGQEFFH